MGKESQQRKQAGFARNFGVGCLLDIVLMAGFACAVRKDAVTDALAYGIT